MSENNVGGGRHNPDENDDPDGPNDPNDPEPQNEGGEDQHQNDVSCQHQGRDPHVENADEHLAIVNATDQNVRQTQVHHMRLRPRPRPPHHPQAAQMPNQNQVNVQMNNIPRDQSQLTPQPPLPIQEARIHFNTSFRRDRVEFVNDDRDLAVFDYLWNLTNNGDISRATIDALSQDLGGLLSQPSTMRVTFNLIPVNQPGPGNDDAHGNMGGNHNGDGNRRLENNLNHDSSDGLLAIFDYLFRRHRTGHISRVTVDTLARDLGRELLSRPRIIRVGFYAIPGNTAEPGGTENDDNDDDNDDDDNNERENLGEGNNGHDSGGLDDNHDHNSNSDSNQDANGSSGGPSDDNHNRDGNQQQRYNANLAHKDDIEITGTSKKSRVLVLGDKASGINYPIRYLYTDGRLKIHRTREGEQGKRRFAVEPRELNQQERESISLSFPVHSDCPILQEGGGKPSKDEQKGQPKDQSHHHVLLLDENEPQQLEPLEEYHPMPPLNTHGIEKKRNVIQENAHFHVYPPMPPLSVQQVSKDGEKSHLHGYQHELCQECSSIPTSDGQDVEYSVDTSQLEHEDEPSKVYSPQISPIPLGEIDEIDNLDISHHPFLQDFESEYDHAVSACAYSDIANTLPHNATAPEDYPSETGRALSSGIHRQYTFPGYGKVRDRFSYRPPYPIQTAHMLVSKDDTHITDSRLSQVRTDPLPPSIYNTKRDQDIFRSKENCKAKTRPKARRTQKGHPKYTRKRGLASSRRLKTVSAPQVLPNGAEWVAIKQGDIVTYHNAVTDITTLIRPEGFKNPFKSG